MANPSVEEKIKAAAAAKGIPADLALRIAGAESSYTTNAKNSRSTAGGLFQVVDDTWKRYGGAPGKKYDVDENIRVGTDIIADNMGRMRKVLNREPSYSEVYAAHFFGPTGAKEVINATPDTPSNKVFSAKVLRDNPNLQNKTTAEIMTMLDRKMSPRGRSAPPAPRGPAASEFAAPGRADPMLLTQNTQALPDVPRETMLAALGPNYQAALALSYLSGNTSEDDSDLETAKDRIAADKESARSPGAEWLMQESRPSPFASLDLTASAPFAQPVARMAKGGEADKDKVEGDEDKSFFEEKSAKQRLDEMQNPPDKGPYVGSEPMPRSLRLQLQGEIANDSYGGAGGFGRATYAHPISSEAALRAYIEGGGYKPKDRDYKGQVNNMGVSYNIGFSDGGDVSKKKVTPLSERYDLGKAGEFDPIGNAKKTLQGAWDVAKKVPGNLQALVTDPVAYAKSLPEPSAQQLLNALGPGNVGGPLVAGIMMGPKSRTWNQKSFEDAVNLAGSKGNLMPPKKVWEQTGNIPNPPDYVPRQEINDSNAKFRVIPPDKLKTEIDHAVRMTDWIDRQLSSKDSGNMSMDQRQQLLNVRSGLADKIVGLSRDPYTEGMPAKYMLEHPELYAAYPELADTSIRLYRGSNSPRGTETAGAYWDRNNNAVNINEAMLKDPRFDPRLAALHEMQHAVQDIEGMSQGTNPSAYYLDMDNFLKFYEKRIDDPKLTQQKATELAKNDWYRAHQGEAEARQTTDRADMTDAERRSTFPEYDIPPDTLLSPPNPNWEFVGNMSHGGAVHRAEGSPPEGEKPQVDNPASAKAAAMLRGFGDSAYSLAGGPVDLATMAMRLAGYKAEKPVLGSDWIKQKAEEYGIRPADETDPQLNRLRQGSEFVSSFVNPAVPVRAAAAATTKSAEMLKNLPKAETALNLAQRETPALSSLSSMAVNKGATATPFYSKLDEHAQTLTGPIAPAEFIKQLQNKGFRGYEIERAKEAMKSLGDQRVEPAQILGALDKTYHPESYITNISEPGTVGHTYPDVDNVLSGMGDRRKLQGVVSLHLPITEEMGNTKKLYDHLEDMRVLTPKVDSTAFKSTNIMDTLNTAYNLIQKEKGAASAVTKKAATELLYVNRMAKENAPFMSFIPEYIKLKDEFMYPMQEGNAAVFSQLMDKKLTDIREKIKTVTADNPDMDFVDALNKLGMAKGNNVTNIHKLAAQTVVNDLRTETGKKLIPLLRQMGFKGKNELDFFKNPINANEASGQQGNTIMDMEFLIKEDVLNSGLNHFQNSVKHGLKWFQTNLPKRLMPEVRHAELFADANMKPRPNTNPIAFSRFTDTSTQLNGKKLNGMFVPELQSDLLRSVRERGQVGKSLSDDFPKMHEIAGEMRVLEEQMQQMRSRIDFNTLGAAYDTLTPNGENLATAYVNARDKLGRLQSQLQAMGDRTYDVTPAFTGMEDSPQVLQQLMAKNVVLSGIKRNKNYVAFPGAESDQAQIYKKLPRNLEQVVKDLGPGFELQMVEVPLPAGVHHTKLYKMEKAGTIKFPTDANGIAIKDAPPVMMSPAIVWGPEAAARIMKQGVRFNDGGMVERQPDDNRRYL